MHVFEHFENRSLKLWLKSHPGKVSGHAPFEFQLEGQGNKDSNINHIIFSCISTNSSSLKESLGLYPANPPCTKFSLQSMISDLAIDFLIIVPMSVISPV